ncbi:MAG: hypothetical protein AAGF57_14390 [Pseudomonadota bacterium]
MKHTACYVGLGTARFTAVLLRAIAPGLRAAYLLAYIDSAVGPAAATCMLRRIGRSDNTNAALLTPRVVAKGILDLGTRFVVKVCLNS